MALDGMRDVYPASSHAPVVSPRSTLVRARMKSASVVANVSFLGKYSKPVASAIHRGRSSLADGTHSFNIGGNSGERAGNLRLAHSGRMLPNPSLQRTRRKRRAAELNR
jgi:hypothetical protein